MNRRTALGLLAVAGLTGCSLQPIEWVENTAEPEFTLDPAVEVRADFFVQTSDPGVKTIDEGVDVGLRISTPYFDGWLEQTYLGERLGQATAAQARQRSEIRAPHRHEFLAFTLRAGHPAFLADGDSTVQHRLRVGTATMALGEPFGRYLVGDTAEYEIAWALIVVCVPIGEPVFLDVTDQDQTVSVNLATGEPVDDEAWALTAGFRERQLITLTPPEAVFAQAVTSVPPAAAGIEADQSVFRMQLRANDRASLLAPWTPALGWAEPGSQWLRLTFALSPEFDHSLFSFAFTVPETFLYEDSNGVTHKALYPDTVTHQSTDLGRFDVVWPVSGTDATGTVRCRPTGVLLAHYPQLEAPAQFVGDVGSVEFRAAFSPAE